MMRTQFKPQKPVAEVESEARTDRNSGHLGSKEKKEEVLVYRDTVGEERAAGRSRNRKKSDFLCNHKGLLSGSGESGAG